MILDQMERAIQVAAGLLVHRNPVRARVGKCGNKFVRILDHQVAVERQLRHFAQRFYDGRANRKIRNEMSIHDVHMDNTRPAFPGGAHLLASRAKSAERIDGASSIKGKLSEPGRLGNDVMKFYHACGAGTLARAGSPIVSLRIQRRHVCCDRYHILDA